MRTIKFRGKRIDNGEWVCGWFVGYSEAEGYIYGDYVDNNEVWRVNRESVGQYTGLNDKKGKEIYERDIVITRNPYSQDKVVYHHVVPSIDHLLSEDLEYPFRNVRWNLDVEVVSNTHDNPALLEGE